MCPFSSRNWFFCTNSCTLPWLVKGATQFYTSKKECNKLDLTALSIFDWSIILIGPGGLLIVVTKYAVPVTVLLVWLPKKTQLNLDI
jgi:hypothetical protein